MPTPQSRLTKQWMIACLTAGMIVVLILGAVFCQQCVCVIECRRAVFHTQDVIAAVTELRSALKDIETAGLNKSMSPHKLRHFLFTWLKKQGIDDALIQPYSGHASRKSLEVYSQLSLV